MNHIRIFISSVQSEFAQERSALRDYLRGDPLMRRFFGIFLFEDVPALDRRPDALYLDEVNQSDVYVGLFGNDYGSEDIAGASQSSKRWTTHKPAVLLFGKTPQRFLISSEVRTSRTD